jgi:hypothetical protein
MLDLKDALWTASQAFAGIGEVATRDARDIVEGLNAFEGILRALLPALRDTCPEKLHCESCFFSRDVAPTVCAVLADIVDRALCAVCAQCNALTRNADLAPVHRM